MDIATAVTAAALEDDEEEEDDDSEFFKAFREKRLLELKTETRGKQFGSCIDVGMDNFLEEVENEDLTVLVIVHLFEPSVTACVRLNRVLDEVAPHMPTRKFLRLQGAASGMALDRVTLPILTFYRGGESVLVLAGIAQTLGSEFFTREDVEWLIESSILAAVPVLTA